MPDQQPNRPAEDAPLGALKAAFESTGSPHWIMYTIQRLGLDRKLGFTLQIDYLDDRMSGARHATEQALVDETVDFIDTDWITLARCRHQGLRVSAVYPYGRILGGLVVPSDSGIDNLPQLRGKTLGVVSTLDKNWILARAYAQKRYQFDLASEVSLQQARSKSVLKQWLDQRRVDAALVYWHQIPFLAQQQDYRLLLDIPSVLPELGLTPTPTTFFVFRDQFIAQRPALVRAFIKAFERALRQLHNDDALWLEIAQKLLHIDDPQLLAAMREIWRSRMPGSWNRAAIEELQGLYQQLEQQQQQQGETLGAGDQLPDGCFNWQFMTPSGDTRATPPTTTTTTTTTQTAIPQTPAPPATPPPNPTPSTTITTEPAVAIPAGE
ncbi:MAG: ABC transporter substrate-binding protein [Motiliproteus sp.]